MENRDYVSSTSTNKIMLVADNGSSIALAQYDKEQAAKKQKMNSGQKYKG